MPCDVQLFRAGWERFAGSVTAGTRFVPWAAAWMTRPRTAVHLPLGARGPPAAGRAPGGVARFCFILRFKHTAHWLEILKVGKTSLHVSVPVTEHMTTAGSFSTSASIRSHWSSPAPLNTETCLFLGSREEYRVPLPTAVLSRPDKCARA